MTYHIAFTSLENNQVFDFHRLSTDTITSANRFNRWRRQQYLVSRIMLAELLNLHYGYNRLPTVKTSDNGRPYFPQHNSLDFSISHSGNLIAVSLGENNKVGLDVELKRPRDRLMTLAKHRFSSEEYLWLNQLSSEQFENAFWQLWTIRESLLKLADKGIWQMKSIKIEPESHQIYTPWLQQFSSYTDKYNNIFWSLSADIALKNKQVCFWQMNKQKLTLITTNIIKEENYFSASPTSSLI